MTLQNININDLTVSPLNVRKYCAKSCDDLMTSIRALGLLQPLLVRPNGDQFEVIAGQRRLNALRILAEEQEIEPVPCMVMAEGDDATAIEASLAENIERLPMDEIDQFKAFSKLIKEGREVADIASTFGITERLVTQRLALGRLYAPILAAYRKEAIHARGLRILTMATVKQQKAWWALIKEEDAYAPTGQRLKDWPFGGAHIPTANAEFDVEASGLAIVTDLFGEDAYFADSEAFWAKQDEAVQMITTGHEVQGWAETVVLERGAYFAHWDYRTCSKDDDGRVFITASHQREVTEHKGYITSTEAKRRDKAQAGTEPALKPELTKPAQNYVDLHRHAAVRADMIGQGSTALRMIAAHMLAGSDLWHVKTEPQRATKPEIADSLATNTGQAAFEAERKAVAQLLGCDEGAAMEGYIQVEAIFARLCKVSDEDVLRVLTLLMAQSLSVHSPLVDVIGTSLNSNMRDHWQPDETLFTLVRDRNVLNAMVGEFASQDVAKANEGESAKTHKAILDDCASGERSPANPNWTPRFMAFPSGSYREDKAVIEVEPAQEDPKASAKPDLGRADHLEAA